MLPIPNTFNKNLGGRMIFMQVGGLNTFGWILITGIPISFLLTMWQPWVHVPTEYEICIKEAVTAQMAPHQNKLNRLYEIGADSRTIDRQYHFMLSLPSPNLSHCDRMTREQGNKFSQD